MIRRILFLLALTAGALLAFIAIAPNGESQPAVVRGVFAGDSAVGNARAELGALNDSAIALDRALERAVALEAARDAQRSAAPTAFLADARLDAGLRAEFGRMAQEQLASLGDPKVSVRVTLVGVDRVVANYRHLSVLPSSADEPCVNVLLVPRDRAATRPSRYDRLVGPCGFYARYGLPGRGMLTWMDTSYAFAFMLDAATAREPRDPRRRDYFVGATVARAPSLAACIAGRDEACGAAFAGQDWYAMPRDRVQVNEGGRRVMRASAYAARWPESSYIARLRDHVGEDAFAKLWTSDLAPPLAYEQVMGEPFAAFARPLFLEQIRPHEPGPLRAQMPLAVSLSFGALCAAWAIRRTRRERS